MSMRCPACAGTLGPVDTQGHYGARMTVDSCTQCRGFWLKAIEPVGLGYDAVLALEGDADFADVSTRKRDDFRACPKCGTALEEIIGGALPEGLHVDSCRTCRGMWFDRGELLVYKSALEQRRRTHRAEELRNSRAREQAARAQARFGGRAAQPHSMVVWTAAEGLANLL